MLLKCAERQPSLLKNSTWDLSFDYKVLKNINNQYIRYEIKHCLDRSLSLCTSYFHDLSGTGERRTEMRIYMKNLLLNQISEEKKIADLSLNFWNKMPQIA